MAIKKAFAPVMELLEANKTKSVSSIMVAVMALASTKAASSSTAGSNYIKDAKGNTVAINCYYFKRWMPTTGSKAVTFGVKKTTATGLNTMCNIGSSRWTAQNVASKKAQVALMATLRDSKALKDIKDIPTFIEAAEAKITSDRAAIAPTKLGFATKDELLDYLKAEGIELVNNEGATAQA